MYLIKVFKNNDQANLRIVNIQYITLDLNTSKFNPYGKLDNMTSI